MNALHMLYCVSVIIGPIYFQCKLVRRRGKEVTRRYPTADMQGVNTHLKAGWDLVGETDNGTEDVWWILQGQDYPRLWWELIPQN